MRRWSKTDRVDSHQYLINKGVRSYELRPRKRFITEYLSFNVDGEMVNIQSINANGEKRTLPKVRKRKGVSIFLEMLLTLSFFCEGYSTGASIYEATKIASCYLF